MMNEAVQQSAASVPPNKRKQFLAGMAKVELNWFRNLAVNSMVLTFTTEELNALADFYGSPMGRSILKKMPAYMGALMPAMEQGLIEESKKVLSPHDRTPRRDRQSGCIPFARFLAEVGKGTARPAHV